MLDEPNHDCPGARIWFVLAAILVTRCSSPGFLNGVDPSGDGGVLDSDMARSELGSPGDASEPGDAGPLPDASFTVDAGSPADAPPIPTQDTGRGGCVTDCSSVGKNCGSLPDGCGGFIDCGFCTPPQVCHGGGTANVCGGSAAISWTDTFQTGTANWGFSGMGVEHPISTSVTPDDANGANMSVVPNPVGGPGQALRHFALLDPSARSQIGIYNDQHPEFDTQATSAEGIWVAQQWYFPEKVSGGDWINLWDWHSTVSHQSGRWDTCPGLMLQTDGSMKVKWSWHGASNPDSQLSSIALPVGRWFDIEMYYKWTSGTTTIQLWIDGQEALRQDNVQTKDPSHKLVQMYIKLYGAGNWTPKPTIKYTRNVRIAGQRITGGP